MSTHWLKHTPTCTCTCMCTLITVPLTSNLSVHACPLASDSKAARVRRPRYSRVNIRTYASTIRVTRVCARVTSARSTRERVSIASIPRPLPPRKKVEGLGTRLACPLRVNLVSARVFEYSRILTRVPACACASTRVRHARAVKLLVSGTVGTCTCTCNKTMACRNSVTCAGTTSAAADHTTECGGWPQIT